MRLPSGENAGSRMPVRGPGVCAEKAVTANAATAATPAPHRVIRDSLRMLDDTAERNPCWWRYHTRVAIGSEQATRAALRLSSLILWANYR